MPTIEFSFTAPSYGRSISDDKWETVDLAHIALWKTATKLLSKHDVSVGNHRYLVEIDWASTLRQHQRSYAAMETLHSGKYNSAEEAFSKANFPRRGSKNRIKVIVKNGTNADADMAQSVVENILHDVFLMMNISAPGCCDFYRATLQGPKYLSDISISNIQFESALLPHLDRGWPTSKVLELATVISWFRSVRSGTSQVPQNPMERVLFALLHMARMETSPMIVIWFFYAIESLLQTSTGENFAAIVRRLALLIEANEKQTDSIRKDMRKLYDIRNSIVHGGFQVSHPAHNEMLDKMVEDNFSKILESTEFGLAILLNSIQITIERGWKFPKFGETLNGEPITLLQT